MEANLDALAAEVRRDLRGALAMVSLFSRESGRQLIIGVDGLETGHEAERDIESPRVWWRLSIHGG